MGAVDSVQDSFGKQENPQSKCQTREKTINKEQNSPLKTRLQCAQVYSLLLARAYKYYILGEQRLFLAQPRTV